MMKSTLAAITASLLLAGSVQAQEGRALRTRPAAAVNDDEVARFALIALVINQVANDAALTQVQRQAAVTQAMQRNGMTPQRYRHIEAASENDAPLQQRIRAAAQAHIKAVREHQQR